MSKCIPARDFIKLVSLVDKSVELDKQEQNLRLQVWDFGSKEIQKLFSEGVSSVSHLLTSSHIRSKIEGFLKGVDYKNGKPNSFSEKILNDDKVAELSIALHEVMESLKGESDKAKNNKIDIASISDDRILPNLPLPRVAESIGRKIAYYKEYVVSSKGDTKISTEQVSKLYYDTGVNFLEMLESKGFLTLHDKGQANTIKDYLDKDKGEMDGLGKAEAEVVRSMKAISLNLPTLAPKQTVDDVLYFTDRVKSDVSKTNTERTELGEIVNSLKIVNNLVQPANVHFPKSSPYTQEELKSHNKDYTPDSTTQEAITALQNTPVKVNSSLHEFMKAIKKRVATGDGVNATNFIANHIENDSELMGSLFGIKLSDEFALDKRQSVTGQNTSKTTPFNDFIEYYDEVNPDGNNDLYMGFKPGRNTRFYLLNSVLDYHASKDSRHSLTGGEYTVERDSEGYKRLVHQIADSLDLTHKEVMGIDPSVRVSEGLKFLDLMNKADTAERKLNQLVGMSNNFKGVNYASLITGLKAIKDVQNPNTSGSVTSEYNVSTDAVASGGLLKLMEALGTNSNIEDLTKRLNILKNEGNKDKEEELLNDVYGIMQESITSFMDDSINPLDQDNRKNKTKLDKSAKNLLKSLHESVYTNLRDFAKTPTMTFIYGQGKTSSIDVISRKIADDLVDNLGNPDVIRIIKKLTSGTEVGKLLKTVPATQIESLHSTLVGEIIANGLPEKMYDLMDISVNKMYLREHIDRGKRVFKLMNETQGNYFNVLPTAAVINKNVDMSIENLKKYGVPVSKVFDVAIDVQGEKVLTRKQIKALTVMNVSLTHSMDAGQLYTALHETLVKQGVKGGVLAIHDDVRSNPDLVSKFEKAFIDVTKKVIEEYDTHDQILNSIATYTPNVAKTADFKELRAEVDASMEAKKELLKQFNFSTDSLIGDAKWKDVPSVINNELKKPEGNLSANRTEEQTYNELGEFIKLMDPELKDMYLNQEQLDSFVKSSNSPLIKKYLSSGGIFEAKLMDVFFTSKDIISISGTDSGIRDPDWGEQEFLDIDKKEDSDLLTNIIEHEIVHSFTAAYILKAVKENTVDKDIKTIRNSIVNLKEYREGVKSKKLLPVSDYAMGRIDYIVNQTSDITKISEFVAIMLAEPEAIIEINKALDQLGKNDKKVTKTLIAKIFEAIKKFLLSISEKDNAASELLKKSLENVLKNGTKFKNTNKDLALKYQKEFEGVANNLAFNAKEPIKRDFNGHSINYLNYAVASMTTTKIERSAVTIGKSLDNLMSLKFPLYVEARNKLEGVYNSSDALQELVHFISNNKVDKTKKNKILSQFSKLRAERNDLTARQLSEFNRLSKNVSKQQKEELYDFIHKTPLHDYFILSSDLDTVKKIDSKIKTLEGVVNKNHVKDIDNIVHLRTEYETNGKSIKPGTVYNLDTIIPAKSTANDNLRELLALKSIKALGSDKLISLLENTELMNLVKDNVVANKLSTLGYGEASKLNDSLIAEYYEEPSQKRVIKLKDIKYYENGDNTGWKILRHPSETGLGVVYRTIIDSTYLDGAFTDIKLASGDISVTSSFKDFKSVVKTSDGFKVVLTDKEKQSLGLVKDPAQSLVKATAHSLAIQDSQTIRDNLLKSDVRFLLEDGKAEKELLDIIKTSNLDDPWIIKIPEGQYSKLDSKIKALYKPVDKNLSDVKGFDKEVSLVRKDIAYWLIGGSKKSFADNPKYRWAFRITKSVIAGAKMGMVIINPAKIGRDNLSNLSYLSVMGVNPLFVAKQYNSILKEFKEYTDIKQELIQLRIRQASQPDNKAVQEQFKKVQKRLVKSPMHSVYKKGFINSLGTDLIHQNADTLSGMQSDLQKALSFMLKDKQGNNNFLARYIRDLSRVGGNGEDLLAYFAGIVGKADSLKGAEKELLASVERIKEIKSDEDIVNYVSQFMITPNSESVKIGAYATDLTDVLAKETYHRYLTQELGKSDREATETVIESFPDYKENMPVAIKQLSDLGILMFPSFWLRIQKIIYRMVRDKPLNLGVELQIENMLDSDFNNIIDSNIINKYNDFGGIIHSPHEYFGVGSIIPQNVL